MSAVADLTCQYSEEFFSKGYFVIEDLFNEDEVRQALQCFERLAESSRRFRTPTLDENTYYVVEGKRIDRIVWCGAKEPYLLDLAADNRLTSIASSLLGSSTLNQIICQAHFKLPGDQVKFRWHQDSENRGYGTGDWTDINGRGSYVQTVLALDEMDEENGPLMLLADSCKRGHIGLNQNEDLYNKLAEDQFDVLKLKPGSVAFFGPYTIHGSRENTSNRPRRILINGYAYPGANKRSYPGAGYGREIQV